MTALIPQIDWAHGLDVWAKFFSFHIPISPDPQESWDLPNPPVDNVANSEKEKSKNDTSNTEECSDEVGSNVIETGNDKADKKDSEEAEGTSSDSGPPTKIKKMVNPDLPAFRATCYRVGANHHFQSPEVACHFGGIVQDYFGWNVNLKNFHIEVIINIESDHIYVTLGLTQQSKHRRHIAYFGPTTLRPTIAYNMLT